MYYKVTAFPDARENIVEFNNERYRIFITEPAKDNRANRAILEILSKYLNLPVKNLRIIKGHRQHE